MSGIDMKCAMVIDENFPASTERIYVLKAVGLTMR